MILTAKNVKKRFSHPEKIELLKGIDLTVEKGESVAIMGRSGEGKSTLLHILGTLEEPSEGEITISGQELRKSDLSDLRNRHIGFIFQSFHLLEDYTVLQNVLMPAKIGRRQCSKGSVAWNYGLELLERVGLQDRMHHFGKQLSGGEKQRVAIARSLCNDPDILFADEPSGNLDKQNAEAIHSLLLDFVQKEGKSLVLVTHDADLAKRADSLYILREGKLQVSIPNFFN